MKKGSAITLRLDAVERWRDHVSSLTDTKSNYRDNLRNHVTRYVLWLIARLGLAVAPDGTLYSVAPGPGAAAEASKSELVPATSPAERLTQALFDPEALWVELYLLERAANTESNGSIATITCSIRRLYEFFGNELGCAIDLKEIINPRAGDENKHPLTEAWLEETGLIGGSLATRRAHLAQYLRYICDQRDLKSLARNAWRKERIATKAIRAACESKSLGEAQVDSRVVGTLAHVLCFDTEIAGHFLEAIADEAHATTDRIKDRVYVVRGFYTWLHRQGLTAVSGDSLSNPLAGYDRGVRTIEIRTAAPVAQADAAETDDELNEAETGQTDSGESADAEQGEGDANSAANPNANEALEPKAANGDEPGERTVDDEKSEASAATETVEPAAAAPISDSVPGSDPGSAPEPGKAKSAKPVKPKKAKAARTAADKQAASKVIAKPIVVFRLFPRRDTLPFPGKSRKLFLEERDGLLADLTKVLPPGVGPSVLSNLRIGDFNSEAKSLRIPLREGSETVLQLSEEIFAQFEEYWLVVQSTPLAEVIRTWHDLAPLFFSCDGGTLFVDEPEQGTSNIAFFLGTRNRLVDFLLGSGKFTLEKLVKWPNAAFRCELSRQVTMNSDNPRVVELEALVRQYDQSARLSSMASHWLSGDIPLLLGADGGELTADEY